MNRAKRRIHICNFDSAEHLRGRRRTYDAVKAAVLDAGKYSVFEATSTQANARLFTRLDRDPDVERYELPYPWIGLRRRVPK